MHEHAYMLYIVHVLYSVFSNGTTELVMIANIWPCKFHASMLCITLAPCKAVHDSMLQTFIVDRTLQTVCDSTLQYFCDRLAVQGQLHNDMCDNNVVAVKPMCATQDPVVAGKLKAAAGLAFLQAKKYKQAAKRFTEVGSGYCSLP